jgi:hypothetical protein
MVGVEALDLIGMYCIDQNDGADLVRVESGKATHDRTAERVADEHVRLRSLDTLEERVQPSRGCVGIARPRARRRPAESGSIVGDYARETCDLGLHPRPPEARRAETGLENDRRTRAVLQTLLDDVQRVARNLDVPPRHTRRGVARRESHPSEERAGGENEGNATHVVMRP